MLLVLRGERVAIDFVLKLLQLREMCVYLLVHDLAGLLGRVLGLQLGEVVVHLSVIIVDDHDKLRFGTLLNCKIPR